MDNTRKNISVVAKEDCCGCRACADTCPFSAITYEKGTDGFMYPKVSTSCVLCGKCLKVCPALNKVQKNNQEQQYIGCLDKDKVRRDTGSSGGVFGLLALYCLDNNYWVAGAAFEENHQLRHIIINDRSSLEPLKKSKYLQSDCTGTYHRIQELLKVGDKVLFVGTPCQCNALLNCFPKTPDNLVVVDFACHGVPSQDFFDKCLRFYEEKKKCKVLSYSFRHKPKRYSSPQNYTMVYEKNGMVQRTDGMYYEEPFYYAFQKRISLRESCYSCKWANTQRVSDLTLADFWGVENVTNRWDRTDTPSLIICNTAKGQKLFDKIEGLLDCLIVDQKKSIEKNASLKAPTELPKERASFLEDMQLLPFENVVKKHLTPSFKMRAILGLYYATPFSIRKKLLKFIHL